MQLAETQEFSVKDGAEALATLAEAAKDVAETLEKTNKVLGILKGFSALGPYFAAVGAAASIITMFTGGGDPVSEALDRVENSLATM